MKTATYIHHYPRRPRRRSWGLMPHLRPSLALAILLGWAACFALAWFITWAACELQTFLTH